MVLSRARLGRAPALTAEESLRLEALHVLGRGLAVVDPVSAMYVKARYLVDAHALGSRQHVDTRGRTPRRRASPPADANRPKREKAALRDGAHPLGGREGPRRVRPLPDHVRHLPIPARRLATRAPAPRPGLRQAGGGTPVERERERLRDLRARVPGQPARGRRRARLRLLADAEQRGATSTRRSTSARATPWRRGSRSDDVDGARRHLRESMQEWSKTRFLVQHWQSMLWEARSSSTWATGRPRGIACSATRAICGAAGCSACS